MLWARGWACGLFLLALLASGGAQANDYQRSVFRSLESRSESIELFSKWVSMLERKIQQQPALDTRGCSFDRYEPCGPYYWRAFLQEQRGKPPRDQILAANTYINGFDYVTDQINWNVPDYWETPLEFLDRRGDCEDFAIAKYVTLKALGFPPADMRIVVVQDMSLNGAGHAVLLLQFEGKTLVLDNQVAAVTSEDKVLHYRAVFSINEQYWWKHVYLR